MKTDVQEIPFDPLCPGGLKESLVNLKRPGRLVRMGGATLVANDYRIEVSETDYRNAFLEGLGPDLARQLGRALEAAVALWASQQGTPIHLADGADRVKIEFGQAGPDAPLADGRARIITTWSPPRARRTLVVADAGEAAAPAGGGGTASPTGGAISSPGGLVPVGICFENGPLAGRELRLTAPVVKLGRGPDAEGRGAGEFVQVDHRRVSRLHAELRRRGGDTFVVDLESRNGTFLNDDGIALEPLKEYRLRPGDRIGLAGEAVFRLLGPGEGEKP